MVKLQSVLRNDVTKLFSTVSLRFVLSRVCVFLYSLGPLCIKACSFGPKVFLMKNSIISNG